MVVNNLTPTEKEIFGYIKDGLSISEIAKSTTKTEGTIRQQVKSILKKLGVKRRCDALSMLFY
jgi:DNA-binding NarL/FixJ family response regulator